MIMDLQKFALCVIEQGKSISGIDVQKLIHILLVKYFSSIFWPSQKLENPTNIFPQSS